MKPIAACIEVAEFRLKPGVTDAALRAGIAASDRYLARCAGFVARRTLRDGDHYADLVEWTDRDSANAAMAAADTSAELGTYFALLDLSTAQMRHFDVLA